MWLNNADTVFLYTIAFECNNLDLYKALEEDISPSSWYPSLIYRSIEHNRPDWLSYSLKKVENIETVELPFLIRNAYRHNNNTLPLVEAYFERNKSVLVKNMLKNWTNITISKSQCENLERWIGALFGGQIEYFKTHFAAESENNKKFIKFGLALPCATGKLEMVKLLVAAGADITGPVYAQVLSNEMPAVALSHLQLCDPLKVAILQGHFHIADFLLSQGASLHSGKKRVLAMALEMCCFQNNLEFSKFSAFNDQVKKIAPIIDYLLKKKAVVSSEDSAYVQGLQKTFSNEVVDGWLTAFKSAYAEQTQLYLQACRTGDISWLEPRIDALEVNQKEPVTGMTPIIAAAEANQPGVVTFLLRHGAVLGVNKNTKAFGVHWKD